MRHAQLVAYSASARFARVVPYQLISLKRERREFHDFSALQRGFMRAQADASPVGGLLCVRERCAIFGERHRKFIREVRMTAAVSTALREAEVRFLRRVIHALRRVFRDALRQ